MTPEAIAFQRAPLITVGYIMQVFFSLLIVLALLWLIARYLLPRMKFANSGKLIRILDRVYLEPQVSAYILKVGKAAWLVMTSSKQIARIDKIEDESLPDRQAGITQ
jgi:flagellar biogenesis protein FliO